MAERIINGYKRLFEVRILHHYWLDEGAELFDSLPVDVQNKRLLTYDVRLFLNVAPTKTTEKRLKQLNCLFKTTALGFVVVVPKAVVIPDDALFEFILSVQNADFFNYTALTLRKQKVYEVFTPAENKVYRFKENVPVFSNLTGDFRGTGANKSLYLSTVIPPLSASDRIESLILSGNNLLQLTSDQPAATTQQFNTPAAAMPVFFHQADAPPIVPPSGLTGLPSRGIELSEEIPDHVFGVIRITAVKAGDADFSCTSGGAAKSKPPVFQIRLKNRSTIWKYYDKKINKTEIPDNSIFTTSTPLPLTFFGNAGPVDSAVKKKKPSSGFVKATTDTNDPTKVKELISEIFE